MTTPCVSLLDPFALDLEGTVLIEASAGTGKTYTITTLVARLVAEGYPIESILVVTFTEAAAAELKLRIRDRLAACLDPHRSDDSLKAFFEDRPDADTIRKRLRLAVTCFDQAPVMTIHAFCLSVLRENAFESGSFFDTELLADSPGFLLQTVQDFFGAQVSNLDPLMLGFLQQSGITPQTFAKDFVQVVSRPGIRTLPDTAKYRPVGDEYSQTVRKMAATLARDADEIAALIQGHSGIDKRSYSKKNVPAWLSQCTEALERATDATVFSMTEKGDALYKFTRTRLALKTPKGSPPDHEFFDQCEVLLSMTAVLEENLVWLRLLFLSFFHKALADMKQAMGACFFDDLINDLWAALDGERGPALKRAVQERYGACLIDEFQDTDPAQYRIFSTLFASAENIPFFMIGDPKQAIYAFRGGDIFAYLCAGKQARARFTLGTNYRSAPGLVRGVNHIFSLVPDPFGFKEIPFYPVNTPDTAFDRFMAEGRPASPLEIAFINRDTFPLDRGGRISKAAALDRFPDLLAEDMLSLLTQASHTLAEKDDAGQDRPLNPGDMAVLVRTNAQAEAVYKALSRRRIPAFLSKSGSVFDSREAVEMFDLLSAVSAPDNAGLIKAALAGALFNCDAVTLARMEDDPALADPWLAVFADLNRTWQAQGFTAMINRVFHGREVCPGPGTGCSERALTNFYHIAELISGAALQKSLSGNALIQWFARQLSHDTREEGADELRLDSDGESVAIVTIHKSKGLEYPVVFLPFLWDRRARRANDGTALFHDPKRANELTLDLGSADYEEAVALADLEQEAEEIRLLYVALTRASALCRIYWAGVAGCEATALGGLFHPGGAGDDAAMEEEILSHIRGTGTDIALTACEPDDSDLVFQPQPPRQRLLEARTFDRRILPSWRITSYSGLIRTREADTEEIQGPEPGSAAAVGPDPAGDMTGNTVVPDTDEAFSWDEVNDHSDPAGDSASDPVLLEQFPKGASAGDFFHGVLESIDFTRPEDVPPVVDACLDRYGFSRDRYRQNAVRAVGDILSTCLGDDRGKGFCLEDIPACQRFTELEFCFDLTQWDTKGLAGLFASDEKLAAYAGRISRMNLASFKGFLKGFIDLIVCHEGRWYLLDYKSNFLGSAYEDYNDKSMTQAMIDHDYLLQFHLYLVALDRYLSLRLPSYDYQTHFGGGFYLFIRGMKPGRKTGIYFHRPSQAFVTRLKSLI